MGIVTDSKTMEEPKDPEGNSIYELYKLFATKEEVESMAASFRAGNYGYGHAKKALLEAYHRLSTRSARNARRWRRIPIRLKISFATARSRRVRRHLR
jgi:tryptophanyl-tRNA synthetase